MLKGIFIGIGVVFGIMIAMAGCSVAMIGTVANSGDVLDKKFQKLAAELEDVGSTTKPQQVSAEQKPAGKLELKVDSFKSSKFGTAEVIVKVNNKTGRNFSMVFVDCAFLDSNGTAIESGIALISNLGSGQTAYGNATVLDNSSIQKTNCRISQTM